VASVLAAPEVLAFTSAPAVGAATATYQQTLGGPGPAAVYPGGVEVVPSGAPNAGDIVVADTGNNQVAEYTPGGTQVWRVGSEGSSASLKSVQFEQPRDVGVDSSGNVYVADNGNGRVVELSSSGQYLNKWKSLPSGAAAPIGITVSATTTSLPNLPAGQRVYVSDGNQNEITVWSTTGTFISAITSTGACQLDRMRDAAADAAGNVFVANYEANDILEFSWNGTAWACAGTWGTKGSGNGQFMNPYGVAVGTDPFIDGGTPGEAIYVADSNNDRIQEFTPSGTYVAQVGSAGTDSQPGTFTQLRRVAVDASGDIWGADLWGYRLEEFVPSYAGGVEQYAYAQTIPNPIVPPGDTSTSVFNQVREISFDSAGDLVAMDTVNQRVDVFNPSGSLLGVCGQRGFTSTGDFNWPRGVAVDPVTGDYWIADTKQSDLQILEPLSDGCAGVAEFVNEGGGVGQLNYPYSITIAGGYAWVADSNNNRIESWNTATCTADAGTCSATSAYGSAGSGTGQFSDPTAIAVDPTTGNLLVADSGNDRVVELSVSAGTVTGVVNTFTGLSNPYGVATNGTYVAVAEDADPGSVIVLNESTGSVAATITGADVTGGGPTTLFDPQDVAFGPSGDLYIADTYNDRILVYSLAAAAPTPTPTPTATATPTPTPTSTPTSTPTPTPTPTPITGPLTAPVYSSTLVGPGQADMYPVDVTSNSTASQSCTTSASGCYYFALDAGNYRLLAVNRVSHSIDWQIGGMQGSGPAAGSPPGSLPVQFSDARAVAYDPVTGDVFVADTANNRVLVFSFSPTSGFSYLTQFGSKGTGAGQFNLAYGVAIDPVNRLVYVTNGAGSVEQFSIGTGAVPTYTFLTSFGAGSLNQPRQVAVAPNSDVFVMNARDHECNVYSLGEIAANSAPEVSFGSLGTGNGQFTDDPRGVAVSADGTMAFVTDSGGDRVEAFSLSQSGGHYSGAAFAYTIANPGGTGGQPFVGLRGLTATADNHLMVSDEWGFNLHEFGFTSTGYTATWSNTPTAPPVPGVNAPRGIQVAANGEIYIVDYWNQRVEDGTLGGNGQLQGAQTFGARGNPGTDNALNFAWGDAIQPSTGDLFVANRESDQVEVFSPTGTTVAIDGKNGSATGDFSFPQGLAFGPNGDLYVADSGNNRIQQFSVNSNGSLNFIASFGTSGSGASAPAGELNQPTGVAVSPNGTLWVADTLNNRVQSLSPSGVWTAFHTTTGTGRQTPFSVPWGVTAAPDGSIWVADTGNNRLVSMSTTGALNWSVTGAQIGVPESAQGNQAIYPFVITFGSDTTVYVSDTWNNRVLVLTTS
jgi:DNA-binding beta-propeller fold protein YncE